MVRKRGTSGWQLKIQAEERRRLARELHDSTAQSLFAIGISLARLQEPSVLPPSDVKDTLVECQALCEHALKEIRTLSYLLHPPMLDQAGLVSALKWYINGFTKRSGIEVGLAATPNMGRLPRGMEMDLFRVVQETLTNIHRHSGSSTAAIRVTKQSSQLVLQIKDRGCGMPAKAATTEAEGVGSLGVGIVGMRQRLRQLGGRLEIESTAQGTTVTAFVPLAGTGGDDGSDRIG
jgi:two-component system, NarL family, sensor kinase